MGDKGKIITGAVMNNICSIPYGLLFIVLGPIDPADLGVTLTHEHLLFQFEVALQSSSYLGTTDLTELDFNLENLGSIRQYP